MQYYKLNRCNPKSLRIQLTLVAFDVEIAYQDVKVGRIWRKL